MVYLCISLLLKADVRLVTFETGAHLTWQPWGNMAATAGAWHQRGAHFAPNAGCGPVQEIG